MIKLQSVYRHEKSSIETLYELLKERDSRYSISHKELPKFKDHEAFVKANLYQCWYLILVDGDAVGAIYLTRAQDYPAYGREIGIQIFKAHQGNGYGTEAVKQLMMRWPGKFYANIHPDNEPSRKLFTRLGMRHIQDTYTL